MRDWGSRFVIGLASATVMSLIIGAAVMMAHGHNRAAFVLVVCSAILGTGVAMVIRSDDETEDGE